MKRIFIVVSILVVVALIIFGGYYLRSRKESPAASRSALPTPQLGGLPTVQPTSQLPANNGSSSQQTTGSVEKLTLVIDNPVLDYFVDAKNNPIFVQPDGQILKITAGETEILSASAMNNVVAASFSFDGKKILIVIGGASGRQASIFDTESKTWQPLPVTAQNPVWSPSDYQVAFFSNAGRVSALSVLDGANPATKPKEMLQLHQEDALLRWVSPDQILIADTVSALWSSSLWSFSPKKKSLSLLMQDQLGLETVWSPSLPVHGLMFSATVNGQGGQLRLLDENGRPLQLLNFLTLPSKCIFYDRPVAVPQAISSSTPSSTSPASGTPDSRTTSATHASLICAVPRDRQSLDNAQLPDAYQKKDLFTSDGFFEINVDSGAVKTVFNDPTKNFDAADLKIFDQKLFFLNRFDNKVYSINL